jgi:hypothetical protein
LTLLRARSPCSTRCRPACCRRWRPGPYEATSKRLRRFATRATAASLPAAALGGIGRALAGPAGIALLYGADFRPSATVVSAVVAGVLLATAAQLVALVIVARGATTQLAVSWPSGLAAATLTLLLVPGDAMTRVRSRSSSAR